MNPMLRTALHWSEVYGDIERRLEAAGAFDALHHLHRMSQPELDLMIQRELDDPTDWEQAA